MLVMVDYVRELTTKKSCKFGEPRWFEHLPFLLSHWAALTTGPTEAVPDGDSQHTGCHVTGN